MKRFSSLFPAVEAGFLFSLILILALIACGSPTTPDAPEQPASVGTSSAPAQEEPTSNPVIKETAVSPPAEDIASEPMVEEELPAFESQTFTDTLERQVTIDAVPETIVSLAPSVTEILFAIGAGSRVIGRTDFCDYPEEVVDIPSIGGFSSSNISIETILVLEPDIVVGGSIYQADLVESLEQTGVTVFVVDPSSLAEIMDTILLLGKVTGNQHESESLVADMQTRLDDVAQIVDTIPEEERLTVFYEIWHEPLMTTTKQTFIGELIELAGGVNIFGDIEEDYPSVSPEQIIESDPAVILGPSNHADQLNIEDISNREGWAKMTAVQNGAVYIVDGNMVSRSGPRVVAMLEIIAAILYPELFD